MLLGKKSHLQGSVNFEQKCGAIGKPALGGVRLGTCIYKAVTRANSN
jgi:hypothetical protein